MLDKMLSTFISTLNPNSSEVGEIIPMLERKKTKYKNIESHYLLLKQLLIQFH
jgi:hypothetical protein